MMKIRSFEFLKARIQNVHPRTRKAHFNTILGLAVKGGGILISLLLVPLTIDYLSKDTYGTWLTISSIVTMLTFLDIGIGNGLRNKFSEAITTHNTTLARAYVSTAYLIFGVLQLAFAILFLLLFRYIPWQRVFNTTIEIEQLQEVVLITVIAMAIKLVLDILSYVLLALQESGQVGLINLLSNVLILIGTYTLTRFTNGNLFYLAIITACSPVIVLLISGIALYQNQLKIYRPSFRLADLAYARSLLSLGYKFFFIQIAFVTLFYTDNLIITQLFGPAEVTTYNIAFRYFNAISTIFAIAITPYWTAFTEASVKKDTLWMKKTYSYLQKLWVVLVSIVILMILASNIVYSLWVGDRVFIPLKLSIGMGLSAIVIGWNVITAAITNGLGKIKLQLYFSIVAAIINVPLAIFFGKSLDLGITGVILATIASLIGGTILGSWQVYKLLHGTADGIWNE
ncbi:oligosaccharide flippase family protein [Spirosoma sp. HMF4905]|uniref:Oligosaccharide flippase family protein n=1 Tax=Spirosoma arboris TaxID=2682092 RepID=A0A7K1S735_9BACT|nr:polysaccharide biosynthesis C-terminal domain-containing protein [Spirosoma arboris]MVM29569.1 oligosaccharide flippase family protein [Spirosoma arboris]